MKLITEIQKADDGVLILNYNGFLPEELDLNKLYQVEIKEYKSKRSIEQNATAWLIISKIAEVTQNDKWQIYKEALRQAGQKAEYILALPQAEKQLKSVYRVVEVLDETREVNGVTLTIFKCYLGSSKFNSSEMSKFIDYLLQVASENSIIIDFDTIDIIN